MSNDNDDDIRSGIVPRKLYDMKVGKGRIGGLPVKIWDKVRPCIGEACELFLDCPYFQTEEKKLKARESARDKTELGVCRVEQKYLLSILTPFLSLLSKVPDPFVMQWVGMHLIPLYHDLVQLKMEKAKLGNLTYFDSKGVKRIHPVYDQLLKTHKEILTVWRTTGLLKIAQDAGYFQAGGKMPSDDDNILDGDPDAYDEMSSGA